MGLWCGDGDFVQVELVVAMVTVVLVGLPATWSTAMCFLLLLSAHVLLVRH